MRLNNSKYFFLIILFFSINSCIKEDFNKKKFELKNYTPGIAIPVLNANLDMHDLSAIDSSGWNLEEDATKFMTLIYRQTETFGADSFLKISNQVFNLNYIFNIDNSLPIGDSITDSYFSVLDFTSSENDLFDIMVIKSGILEVKVNSDLNMRGKLVFRLPNVTKAGNMLVSQFSYSGKPIDLKIDISGYTITFSHVGNSNRISTECDVTAYNDGLPNFSPYQVKLEVLLNDIKFSKVFGYFSSRSFDFSNNLTISLFNHVKSGDSYFEDPKLNLHILNTVGIPVNLNILSFNAHSDIKAPYDIDIVGLPNPINITSPTSPGSSVILDYSLDKSNSNIKDAINLMPSSFKYNVNGVTVKDDIHQNFIFDTSKVNLDVEIELPLFGRVKNYLLEDTFAFSIDNLEMFESLTFNLLLANGLPMETMVQLYFLDENYNMLDSLFVFPQDYLHSALTDILTGKVTQAVSHLFTVFFDRKRLDKITNCRNVHVKAILNTSNLGQYSVKIYSDNSIDIKLSALAKLKD